MLAGRKDEHGNIINDASITNWFSSKGKAKNVSKIDDSKTQKPARKHILRKTITSSILVKKPGYKSYSKYNRAVDGNIVNRGGNVKANFSAEIKNTSMTRKTKIQIPFLDTSRK